jgi:hypothetical protein
MVGRGVLHVSRSGDNRDWADCPDVVCEVTSILVVEGSVAECEKRKLSNHLRVTQPISAEHLVGNVQLTFERQTKQLDTRSVVD